MTTREARHPDRVSDPIERVRNHSLPEHSIRVIAAYEDVLGDRDRFLWRWAHHLFPKFTLSCVDPARADDVRDAKLVGLVYVSVLDDVAEKHEDRATFEEAAKLPFVHQNANWDRAGVDRDVLSFASDVWDEFSAAVDEGPRAAEFREIRRFDLKQILDAIDYSSVANEHVAFVNGSELRTYDAHNMMLFGFAGVDLAHSPGFDRADLATLRKVITRAQRMVRIGNWITTWERELSEGDVASGVVVHALENGIVSVDDLRALREDPGNDGERLVERIREHAVEDVFVRQWHRELDAAREFEGDLDSVDVGAYLDGIETVMDYHLASEGLK